jgi:uncharacterized protein involved in high-affinity Fe2+ transport
MRPLVARGVSHYGDNVKMSGIGKYRLILNIEKQGFGRRTGGETGEGPWLKPFVLTYEFSYVGTGKKGGY